MNELVVLVPAELARISEVFAQLDLWGPFIWFSSARAHGLDVLRARASHLLALRAWLAKIAREVLVPAPVARLCLGVAVAFVAVVAAITVIIAILGIDMLAAPDVSAARDAVRTSQRAIDV